MSLVPESKERRWIWGLCCLAALRVFIFSSAFPFFNNVDEEMHFDEVMKFSRGEVPRGIGHISSESARYIVVYGSPEYLSTMEDLPSLPAPVWMQPPEKVNPSLPLAMNVWRTKINYESSGPPLYYALAGAWLETGRMARLTGGFLLYWIRFLNVIAVVVLVWLGFLAARASFPENQFMRLGLPLLLAFFPQDFFYSIQSEVLSPLCFGAAFIGLIRLLQVEKPSLKLAGWTGLALAAGCLVKTSNLPFLAVGLGTFLFCVWRTAKKGNWRTMLPPLGLFLFCALAPVILQMIWNWHIQGDVTGAGAKTVALGWTRKPFTDWWSHPIFTPAGFWVFWRGLMTTLWRGEFVWRDLPMFRPAMDAFYCLSSTLFICLALASLAPRFAKTTGAQRQVTWLCFASLSASVLFLGALSVVFDFGACAYPSREYPYFASGRLLSGALIPFLLLYLRGLDWGLSKQNPQAKWLALAGIILLMIVSEIVVARPVFSSQYNWFHLWTVTK
jgi:hypothetical protein